MDINKDSNQEGKQSQSGDIQSPEIKQEYDVHREVGIDEERKQLDNIRIQLDLERRRLEEERRQIELEKEKLNLKDSKTGIQGSQAGSSGGLCVICGEKATGMHYMASTCEGCKIFFRRTSKKYATLRCTNLDNQGQCDVVNKRRFCSACRFQKCLDAGMNMGRIWNPDRLKTRKPSKRVDPTPEPKVRTMKTKRQSSEQELQEGCQSTAPAPGDGSGCDVVSSSLGAPVTDAGAVSRTNTATASAGVEASPCASAGAGAGASSGAANPPCVAKEEFTDGHKQLIRSISTAFQNSERLKVFDSSKGSFTELRKSHQMKKSSDTGRAAQMDLPTSHMASGESAAASVPMATKAAKKEDTPIDLSVPESVGASAASGGGMPAEFDFDSDMSKLCMELILHDLRQMIVFVKSLPAYQTLPVIEQATFVKETFPDFWACMGSKRYNPETNSFINHLTDPPEEFFLSDLCLGGAATFMLDYGMNYAINLAMLKLTEEESNLFCALCLLNPDRESFSDLIKQTTAPHYTRIVEVLCARGRINHADQPLWFPQMMSHMAETRKCSDLAKDFLMQLQLQGQSILPLLREVMTQLLTT